METGNLIAPVEEAAARYQPSQWYFLLDEGRWREDDPPRRNLVSAPVRLENSGTAAALWGVMEALSEGLRESGDDELRRAVAEWLRQALPGLAKAPRRPHRRRLPHPDVRRRPRGSRRYRTRPQSEHPSIR